MTAEIKINLLAPADGELMRAEGRFVKHGKRLVIVTSEIHTLKDGEKEVDRHHAGNDDSCSCETLKCLKNSER